MAGSQFLAATLAIVAFAIVAGGAGAAALFAIVKLTVKGEAPGGKSLGRRGSGQGKAERLGDTHSHNSRPVSDPEQGAV